MPIGFVAHCCRFTLRIPAVGNMPKTNQTMQTAGRLDSDDESSVIGIKQSKPSFQIERCGPQTRFIKVLNFPRK